MSRLDLSIEQKIAVIGLSRPRSANAIDLEWARQFRQTLGTIVSDPNVRAILIESSGGVFCAGGDLEAIRLADEPGRYVYELAHTFHEALLMMARAHLPVVCAVQGAAAGAGLGLVLNTDYVVASEQAMFLSAYDALGVSPDAGVSYLLPLRFGPGRAAQVCLAGRRLDATTARDWGLVSEVVSIQDLGRAAREVAARIANTPAGALAATRRLLGMSTLRDFEAHLGAEADSIAELIVSAPSKSRQEAFRQGSRDVG